MKSRRMILAVVVISLIAAGAPTQVPTRARDLGVPFEGDPGPLNAITDVSGLEVGHTTILLEEGPVRTGVTAVLPRGRMSRVGVFANWFALNGNGEMTGTTWVSDRGILKGPVLITNTYSVGAVHEAAIAWAEQNLGFRAWTLPMVAETWDGFLNDITGFHVRRQHVFAALDSARGGPVEEGSVGGGTGMRTFEFKSGIGTASRRVRTGGQDYTLGVLVQSNFGRRPQLRIAGVPVGREIPDLLPENPPPSGAGAPAPRGGRDGSIIIIAATDAPLLPHQLKRLARRASLGLGRLGSISMNGSGDIFVAFSTANEDAVANESGEAGLRMLANSDLNPLFEGVVQATEEAIVNSMIAARDMTGVNGRRIYAIPHERLQEILRRYDRLLAATPD